MVYSIDVLICKKFGVPIRWEFGVQCCTLEWKWTPNGG